MHKGFQLHVRSHSCTQRRQAGEAHFPGKNDPAAPQVPVMPHARGIDRARLGAYMQRQSWHLLPQGANRPQVAHNGRIHPNFPCLAGCLHKAGKLIVKGENIHGYIEFFPLPMAQLHSLR